MEFDDEVKLAVYRHFADTGERPRAPMLASHLGADTAAIAAAFERLGSKRVLVLEPDGVSIRMAPPFSGVPTQHEAVVGGLTYFANCAWDALGIPAALREAGTIVSRCEQSQEPFQLTIGAEGPAASDWLFHTPVPAAKWWDDIVFT